MTVGEGGQVMAFATCKEKSKGAGKSFLLEKWRQDVPWLKTNNKRTEICTHVCAVHRGHTGELNQLIATL